MSGKRGLVPLADLDKAVSLRDEADAKLAAAFAEDLQTFIDRIDELAEEGCFPNGDPRNDRIQNIIFTTRMQLVGQLSQVNPAAIGGPTPPA